ncbi:MAG: hypothetical protein ACE5QV_06640, partial [Fidelibacterota bacterium]
MKKFFTAIVILTALNSTLAQNIYSPLGGGEKVRFIYTFYPGGIELRLPRSFNLYSFRISLIEGRTGLGISVDLMQYIHAW